MPTFASTLLSLPWNSDVLVSAEAHGNLKVRENRLHGVLDAVNSSESEAIHIRPSDQKE